MYTGSTSKSPAVLYHIKPKTVQREIFCSLFDIDHFPILSRVLLFLNYVLNWSNVCDIRRKHFHS